MKAPLFGKDQYESSHCFSNLDIPYGKSTVKHSFTVIYSSYTEGNLTVNAAVN